MNEEKTVAYWIQEMYYWQYARSDNFACKLLDLIGKADMHNRERIRAGFPNAVAAYEAWERAESQDIFFKSHGFLS